MNAPAPKVAKLRTSRPRWSRSGTSTPRPTRQPSRRGLIGRALLHAYDASPRSSPVRAPSDWSCWNRPGCSTRSWLLSEAVYTEWKAYHDQRYSAFSSLVRTTFDDALGHFRDGSIDLLNLDGFHSRDAVRHDFETWLPKVSTRGVVLLHDINVRGA